MWCGEQVQGSYYVNVNRPEEAAQWRRIQGQKIMMPLQMAFAVFEVVNLLTMFLRSGITESNSKELSYHIGVTFLRSNKVNREVSINACISESWIYSLILFLP